MKSPLHRQATGPASAGRALARRDTLQHVDDHALRVLEFDKLVTLLAAETSFSCGRELALALRPASDFDSVRAAQALTAEMRRLDQMGIDIPFAGARDIRGTIRAAAIAQLIEPSDLVEAAGALRATARARNTIERLADRVPGLARIVERIRDLRPFTDAVETAIGARGEVADSASEQLATARRELRIARERLEQRAQAALADAIRRDLAQEALLTERNGRKVIPVKADFRGRVTGIVHDVSSSGATVFIEPVAVVEAGNQVRELELAEDREVRRVLQRLASLLGSRAEDAEDALSALAELDLLHAKVRLGRRIRADLPPPGDGTSWLAPDGLVSLLRARHPLLAGDVVPIDLDVGGHQPGLLITGPNTGGKTVALKTVGLLTLMAQAGIPISCAEGSRVVVFEQVFADIGDEQSLEQSLSTFSSHMRTVTSILAHARPRTLVLLDELGAGTDPAEGSALARAIVEELLDRGCTVVATTHHGELKVFAHNDPRLRNASVEFDLETLSPTYHLTIGLPGQSNAIAIAERLGLEEGVLARARSQVAPGHVELERLLAEIRAERAYLAAARRQEEAAAREAEDIRLSLARGRDDIERERANVIAGARREAEDELTVIRRELDALRRRSALRGFDPAAADGTLRELDARIARLKQRSMPQRPEAPLQPLQAIVPGARLFVRDIPQPGEALGEVGEDGKVEAQFGSLRMKVGVERIERVETPAGAIVTQTAVRIPAIPQVGIQLDLRGQRAEEALGHVEAYLDDAFRSGLPFVRIIHGKGTGALRAAVRDVLAQHPLVRRYEPAAPNEGGDGVTIAVLAG